MPLILVGAVAFVIAGLVALLVAYGSRPLGQLIRNVINSVIPSWLGLGDIAGSVIDSIVSGMLRWLDSWISPVVGILAAPANYFVNMFSAIEQLTTDLLYTDVYVLQTAIPAAVGKLRADVNGELNYILPTLAKLPGEIASAESAAVAAAEGWASAAVNKLRNDVDGEFNLVIASITATAAHVLAQAEAEIGAGVSAAESAAVGLFRTAESDIAGLAATVAADVSSLTGLIASDVARIEADIVTAEQTAIDTTLGILVTDVDNAVARVATDVIGAVDGAIAVGAGDFADILDWLKGIDLTKITDIAGVTALGLAVTGALARYLEECGLPNCRNLSQLGRDLQALLGLVGDASILALLVELATNPAEGARVALDLITPISDATMSAGRSLLGV